MGPIAGPVRVRGFYAQALCAFGRQFAVVRYGRFHPEGSGGAGRLSTGFGRELRPGCEVRVEYQDNEETRNNRAFAQLVVAF